MDISLLKETAKAMVAPGKGILAIDESHGTCKKRFDAYNIECNEENRRTYRGMLIGADGVEEFISGIILFDETIKQKTSDGTPFPEVLKNKGILPGIKVDTGAVDFADHPGEKVTEGLEGLAERLAEYRKLGAAFAKWRAVITVPPSEDCINANAKVLAGYASLCQQAGIVPMVEPETLMDGEHTIDEHYEATARILRALFAELKDQGVMLEGTILKVNMVLSGKAAPAQADVQEVAEKTIKCLKENVPAELAGIVFLSGGQTDEKATEHLSAMNKMAAGSLPWPLSFSYGRALQAPALKIWAVELNNSERAQRALVHRSKLNSLATQGKYEAVLEKEVSTY